MTQHRTAARRILVSMSWFTYHKMLRLLLNRGLVGSQTLNSLPNEDFRLKRLYKPQKSSPFSSNSIFALQTSIIKQHSSNSIFKLQFSRFFRQIVQFPVIKNLFEKMSLARWFWAFFEKSDFARKMDQNDRFLVFSSSISKMEANKIAKSFPTYRILAFEVW